MIPLDYPFYGFIEKCEIITLPKESVIYKHNIDSDLKNNNLNLDTRKIMCHT